MTYSIQRIIKIHNDETGQHITIQDDDDGLDLIEIKQYDSDDKLEARISLLPEEAQAVVSELAKF